MYMHAHVCGSVSTYMREKNKIAYIENISKKGTIVLSFKQGDCKWV
jgi:hypothetical protein